MCRNKTTPFHEGRSDSYHQDLKRKNSDCVAEFEDKLAVDVASLSPYRFEIFVTTSDSSITSSSEGSDSEERLSDLSWLTNIFSPLLHLIKIPFLGVRGHSSTMETSREGLCALEISKKLVKRMNKNFL